MDIQKSSTGDEDGEISNNANYAEKLFANDLILRKICKFLSVTDMKNFRMVCWDFEKASQISFRAKAKVNFISVRQKLVLVDGSENVVYKENEDGSTTREVPADINSFFKWLMSDSNIPFTAASFVGPIPWTTLVLTEFFSNGLGRFIRELKMDWPIFVDEGKNKLKEWDISPLISPSLKKLTIRTFKGHPVVTFSMDKLSTVDIVRLKDCKVIYSGQKISPKEISLENVKFVVNGNEEEESLVNKYINFKRIEKLAIFGLMYKLDMSQEDISLNQLDIYSTKNMKNLENSRWTIKNAMFTIDHSVRNLKIKNFISSPSEIDVSFLPLAMENLYCSHFKCFKNTGTFPVDLPKLKYVELKCNLGAIVDANCLPTGVKEIKMQQDVKIIGEKESGVDVVSFNSCNLDFVKCLEEVLNSLKPKHIIASNFYKSDVINNLVEFIQSHPTQRMTLGKFRWDKNATSVQHSPLSKVVDEKADFYAFENGRGIPCSPPVADKRITLMVRPNPFSIL